MTSRNEFMASFLKMIQNRVEKELPDNETESEMLRHASQITVEYLKHIADSV